MIPYRLLILGGVVILLGLSTLAYRERYLATSEKLDAAEARIEGYEEAARIHSNYVVKLQEQIEAFDDLGRDLQQLDGRDAPLSDHLSNASRKLWP
jgi:hypothetical protein